MQSLIQNENENEITHSMSKSKDSWEWPRRAGLKQFTKKGKELWSGDQGKGLKESLLIEMARKVHESIGKYKGEKKWK